MIYKVHLLLCLAVAGLMALPERASYSYNTASGWGPDGSKVQTGPHGVYVSGPGYYAGATSFSSGAAPSFPKFPAFPAFPTFTYPFNYANQYPFAAMQNYFNSLAQNAAALASSGNYLHYNAPGYDLWLSGDNNQPVTVYTAEPGKPVMVNTLRPSNNPSPQASSPVAAAWEAANRMPYYAPKPVKYSAKPYSSFSFPNFPSQPPFSGSGSFSSSSSSSSSSSGFGNPLENRFGEESSSGGSKPGFVGVFSSTSHGTSNVNGKEESFHVSTTGVNENGKVTSVTVHKP